MHNLHKKNSIRYFLFLIIALTFLFFTGDFGLIDVQKTAIVMAVGIDREEDTFIVTSQIAIPQSSKQGNASETVQLVSRGKTVADAFEEINVKTGWYPKLVFCRLILLGEKTAEKNVFDALDFFLLDEYLTDNCLVATCDGLAKDLLNVTALVDPSGSVAMQKVLSPHAERVGSVLPSTLREFSIGYFSDSRSGFLPLLKTQPQQEQVGEKGGENTAKENGSKSSESAQNSSGSSDSSSSSSSSSSGSSESSQSSQSSSSGQSESSGGNSSGEKSGGQTDKPVFSASETALFVGGRRVGLLSKDETFAVGAIKHELRLAAYSVLDNSATCTLSVKHNNPKTKFSLGKDKRATLKIELTMSAGLLDYSKALDLEETKDAGDVPSSVFEKAEKLLTSQIHTAFEKCRAVNCDVFELSQSLKKYEKELFHELKKDVVQNAILDVSVRFRNVR